MKGPAETGLSIMPSRVLSFLDTFLSFPTRGVARIALTDRGVTPRFDRRRHRCVHRSRMDDDRTSAGPVALAISTAWVRVPAEGREAPCWVGFDSRQLHNKTAGHSPKGAARGGCVKGRRIRHRRAERCAG